MIWFIFLYFSYFFIIFFLFLSFSSFFVFFFTSCSSYAVKLDTSKGTLLLSYYKAWNFKGKLVSLILWGWRYAPLILWGLKTRSSYTLRLTICSSQIVRLENLFLPYREVDDLLLSYYNVWKLVPFMQRGRRPPAKIKFAYLIGLTYDQPNMA